MGEEGKAVEETAQDPNMDAKQIAQLVAAIVDQKIGVRLQQIETKQATNDAVMEQLPGMVEQFQASLPGMIQNVVQQNLSAVMQQLPPTQAPVQQQIPAQAQQQQQQMVQAPQAQPEPNGAGTIPLGLVVPQQAVPAAPAQAQQQQLPAVQQQKASELVKQMAGGAGGMAGLGALLGGAGDGGGGGGIQQMLMQFMMKKMMGGDEAKQKPPSPVETVMGMTNMMSAFAESLAGLFQSLDMMRAGATSARKEEAQIGKLEAEAEAILLRALRNIKEKENTTRKVGAKK